MKRIATFLSSILLSTCSLFAQDYNYQEKGDFVLSISSLIGGDDVESSKSGISIKYFVSNKWALRGFISTEIDNLFNYELNSSNYLSAGIQRTIAESNQLSAYMGADLGAQNLIHDTPNLESGLSDYKMEISAFVCPFIGFDYHINRRFAIGIETFSTLSYYHNYGWHHISGNLTDRYEHVGIGLNNARYGIKVNISVTF